MYHNVFRYEYLTFQTQIHLHKQYIFDTNIIQSEYALLFPFSIQYFFLKHTDNVIILLTVITWNAYSQNDFVFLNLNALLYAFRGWIFTHWLLLISVIKCFICVQKYSCVINKDQGWVSDCSTIFCWKLRKCIVECFIQFNSVYTWHCMYMGRDFC